MPSKYNNVLLSGVKLDNEDNLGSTTCVVIVTDVAYLIITIPEPPAPPLPLPPAPPPPLPV